MDQLTLQLLDVVIPIGIYSWGWGRNDFRSPKSIFPCGSPFLSETNMCLCTGVCVCTQKSLWRWGFFSGPVVRTGLPVQGPRRDFWLWKFCRPQAMAKKKKSLYDILFLFLLDSTVSFCLLALSLSPLPLYLALPPLPTAPEPVVSFR